MHALFTSDFVLGLLTALVLLGLLAMHLLVIREYLNQRKIHRKWLVELENLRKIEEERSQAMDQGNGSLQEIRGNTQEKLNIIKLQVEAMELIEKKKSSGDQDPGRANAT